MCDESYVFKRKNVQMEIELSFCTNTFEISQSIEDITKNTDNKWHINFYIDFYDNHENLVFCNLFDKEECEELQKQLLAYEFKNVEKQLEMYADFVKRHLDMIMEL